MSQSDKDRAELASKMRAEAQHYAAFTDNNSNKWRWDILALLEAVRPESGSSVAPAEWQRLIELAREEGRIAGKNEAMGERLAALSARVALDDVAVEFDPRNNFCFKNGSKWVAVDDVQRLIAEAKQFAVSTSGLPPEANELATMAKEARLFRWIAANREQFKAMLADDFKTGDVLMAELLAAAGSATGART